MNKVIDYSLAGLRGNSTETKSNAPMPAEDFSQALPPGPKAPPPVVILNTVTIKTIPFQSLQMNHLESLETALYIKDLMKLPKDMKELLTFVQKAMAPTAPETEQLLSTDIDLSKIALLFQQNGKEAVTKLIMAMSNAAKQGITDMTQIKDVMKLINASVSVAGDKNPNQALKSLMLLYLPWLPLQEGVGFDLEVESKNGGAEDSDCIITITISTKNYGNIKATLILVEGNTVSVIINCSDEFPKDELLKMIKIEEKKHSMKSNIVFELMKMKQDEEVSRQAKINMSNSTQINPFLLLMAHSVIRHTIELDRLAG